MKPRAPDHFFLHIIVWDVMGGTDVSSFLKISFTECNVDKIMWWNNYFFHVKLNNMVFFKIKSYKSSNIFLERFFACYKA